MWQPTHRTSEQGAQAWEAPDPGAAPSAPLDPRLDVAVVETAAYGWTRVRCENGWETWVDGSLLVPVAANIVPATPQAVATPHLPATAATSSAVSVLSADDWAFLRLIAPVLQEPPGPAGYPPVIRAQIPSPANPAAAFAPLGLVAPPPGPATSTGAAPTKSAGLARLLPIGLAVVGLVAMAALGFLRSRDSVSPSQAGVVSWATVALMVAMFAMSLLGIRRPGRARPGLELGRALFSLGSVLALGFVTGAPASPGLLAVAVVIGLLAGVIEGASIKVVVGNDRRRYARRAVVPTVVTFVGVVIGVVAATGSQASIVGIGQSIGMVGIGLMAGVPIGRTLSNRNTGRVLAGGAAAVVIGVGILLPALAARPALATLAAPGDLEGRYTGSFTADPGIAEGATITANQITLTFRGQQLTGSFLLAIKESLPDDLSGSPQLPICAAIGLTLTGSELTYAEDPSGAITFNGSTQLEFSLDQVAGACTALVDPGPYATGTLVVRIDEQGMTGRFEHVTVSLDDGFGGGSSGAGAPGLSSFALGRDGATPPPIDGSPAGTPGGSTGGSVVGIGNQTGPDRNDTKLLSDDPIPPEDAAAAGTAVVAALAGAGVITASEAGAARRAIEAGEVPEDVIARLLKDRDLSKLGVAGALQGIDFGPTAEQNAASADRKIAASGSQNHPVFTPGEYLAWVRKIEAQFPGSNWQQITAAIHAGRYLSVGDVDGPFPHTSIKLFEHGPDSRGWESIQRTFVGPNPNFDPARQSEPNYVKNNPPYISKTPWYITDHAGNKIDMNHAMAGLRSDVDRPPDWEGDTGLRLPNPLDDTSPIPVTVGRDFMRWANTDGGDTYQVITKDGKGGFWYHPEYAPPDQRLGNAGGAWLSDFYRNPANNGVPLSDAVKLYIDQSRPH